MQQCSNLSIAVVVQQQELVHSVKILHAAIACLQSLSCKRTHGCRLVCLQDHSI
jgi:hypothetical protein